MSKKKIDDDVMLRMLREGRTQKDVAQHFDCSPVAVCNRLKRLLPPPKSLEALTEKEQRFALEVAKGRTQTQAALSTFEVSSMESAKVIGSQLMAKPAVKQAIEDLLEHHGLSRSYRVQRLRQHVDHADPSVSLKALDMTFKLDASYPPTKNINLNAEIDISPVDLSKYLRPRD